MVTKKALKAMSFISLSLFFFFLVSFSFFFNQKKLLFQSETLVKKIFFMKKY